MSPTDLSWIVLPALNLVPVPVRPRPSVPVLLEA
jgi:hypothetical protein